VSADDLVTVVLVVALVGATILFFVALASLT
jgi:hypothetical protein